MRQDCISKVQIKYRINFKNKQHTDEHNIPYHYIMLMDKGDLDMYKSKSDLNNQHSFRNRIKVKKKCTL